MIEFYDAEGTLGSVAVENGELVASSTVQSFVDSWLAKQGIADPGAVKKLSLVLDPAEFEKFYTDWSNGYVHARKLKPKPLNTTKN